MEERNSRQQLFVMLIEFRVEENSRVVAIVEEVKGKLKVEGKLFENREPGECLH